MSLQVSGDQSDEESESDDDFIPDNDSLEYSSQGTSDDLISLDGEDNLLMEDDWTAIVDNFADVRPSALPEFFGAPGLHPDLNDDLSLQDCISLFLSDNLLNSVCMYTNVRARKFFEENPEYNRRVYSLP